MSSNIFRLHLDCAAWAFGGANPAPFAVVVLKFKTLTRTQFEYGIVRAYAIAVVAFKAIAATQAAPCFEQGIHRVRLARPRKWIGDG